MKRTDIIRLARIELGVKEQPANSNDGPRVRQYQSATGAYHQPWCGSFCRWDYKRAGATDHELRHATADVTTWLAYPHVSAANVLPGDAVVYQWDGGDVDHIGIFEKWIAEPHSFDAIEGNTSLSGNQSNGGEVMRRLRTSDLVAAFVRVKDPEPKKPAVVLDKRFSPSMFVRLMRFLGKPAKRPDGTTQVRILSTVWSKFMTAIRHRGA
jgi:hypothetical protein